MRDYDLEDFLMHYGTKGMIRPKGLKYRTKNNSGSTSVYQHRRDQMYGNAGEEKESSKEWKKEKYIRDVNNRIEEKNAAEDYYQSRTAKKTASSSGYHKYRKQTKGYNNWDKSVKGNEGYSKTESNKNQNNKVEDAKEKIQEMQDRLLGRKKSKSKYGNKFLAHYGIPNMKRPHGLKYKTKNNGSTSLYQRRQEQIHGGHSEDDDTTNTPKSKYRNKTNIKWHTPTPRGTNNRIDRTAKQNKVANDTKDRITKTIEQNRMNQLNKKVRTKVDTAKKAKEVKDFFDNMLSNGGKKSWTEKVNDMQSKMKVAAIKNNKKNIGPSDWTKRTNSMKTQMSKKANANEANKQLKAIEANNKMKSNSLYKTVTREGVGSKYGNDMSSKIKKKNAIQKAKKIHKNGYKG